MEYKYTGIILNKRDIGESDRIYTIYTLEAGKIRSIAKGIRKSQAKLSGALENFLMADVSIEKTRGLGKITGSIVEESFSAMRSDYDALVHIFSSVSFFDKIIELEYSDEEVFFLLKEYLSSMNKISEKGIYDKYSMVSLGFLVKLMDLLGYAMEVDHCVICSSNNFSENICFSPKHGGVL